MAIKLNSKNLKPGDKIIRVAPITVGGVEVDHSFTTVVVTVLKKHAHHIEVEHHNGTRQEILPFHSWNDGNWVRWK